jgi:hypothetical protein
MGPTRQARAVLMLGGGSHPTSGKCGSLPPPLDGISSLINVDSAKPKSKVPMPVKSAAPAKALPPRSQP